MQSANRKLPRSLVVACECVPIDTDFRHVLGVMAAFEDDELTESEKRMLLIEWLYKELVVGILQAIE